jgi:hypothetical protein
MFPRRKTAMHTQIITFYQVCDTYLTNKGFHDDPQAVMTTVEVLTTALVAAFFFANNLRLSRQALTESGLVPRMLSESRFNRRWHKITHADWQAILTLLSEQHPADTFVVDSCPSPSVITGGPSDVVSIRTQAAPTGGTVPPRRSISMV